MGDVIIRMEKLNGGGGDGERSGRKESRGRWKLRKKRSGN